ncbi:MAG: putative ABC-type ATPase [Bacteroidia bacterium]|jgi:predicted ABC-type ATPase
MDEMIESQISQLTKHHFKETAQYHLDKDLSFSFQTNFNQTHANHWCNLFSNKGFETHLIFLFVDDVSICKTRVNKRVKEGGHFVPEYEIEERYSAGLKNLDTSFNLYDKTTIFKTGQQRIVPLLYKDGQSLESIDYRLARIMARHKLKNLESWVIDKLNVD